MNETLNSRFGFIERIHVEGKGYYLNAEDIAKVFSGLGNKVSFAMEHIVDEADAAKSVGEQEETTANLEPFFDQLHDLAEGAAKDLEALAVHVSRTDASRGFAVSKPVMVKRRRRRKCLKA